jgi:hypothetical protein
MVTSRQPPLPSDEIWVRQCTTCGRADLREWFSALDSITSAEWACQLCERSEWMPRELREMLEGRIRPVGQE